MFILHSHLSYVFDYLDTIKPATTESLKAGKNAILYTAISRYTVCYNSIVLII